MHQLDMEEKHAKSDFEKKILVLLQHIVSNLGQVGSSLYFYKTRLVRGDCVWRH